MKIYSFVFARGGSVGLPGKNIMKLEGKPLLNYSIEAARSIPDISEIFVSTDCPEIASIAKDNDVVVISRPESLATNDSAEWLAWKHAVQWVNDNFGSFDCFVSLPTTSPLRISSDITSAIEIYSNSDADICVSITPSARSPYFNMVSVDKDGFLKLGIPGSLNINTRQEAPIMFDLTTLFYITSPYFIMSHNSMFEGKVKGIVIPKERAIDIDDIHDFSFAESILQKRNS